MSAFFRALFLVLAATSLAAKAERTVHITNGEWPPYLSASLPHHGLVSHIVSAAFAQQGVTVEYGFYPWPRALMLAKVGTWDGSAAWARTPERERDFYYSDALAVSETMLYHLKTLSFTWTRAADLAKYRIGVSRDYFYGTDFTEASKKHILKVDSAVHDTINLRKLLGGRIDLFPLDKRVAADLLRQDFSAAERQQITFHAKPLYVQTIHLILSKAKPENQALMEEFNKGLQKLKDSGQLEQLLKQND